MSEDKTIPASMVDELLGSVPQASPPDFVPLKESTATPAEVDYRVRPDEQQAPVEEKFDPDAGQQGGTNPRENGDIPEISDPEPIADERPHTDPETAPVDFGYGAAARRQSEIDRDKRILSALVDRVSHLMRQRFYDNAGKRGDFSDPEILDNLATAVPEKLKKALDEDDREDLIDCINYIALIHQYRVVDGVD